jgi:hypothetical protein
VTAPDCQTLVRDARSVGDILEIFTRLRSRDDAAAFLAAYRDKTQWADENIDRLLGHMDHPEQERLRAILSSQQPLPASGSVDARAKSTVRCQYEY